jgi:hypothetical protein
MWLPANPFSYGPFNRMVNSCHHRCTSVLGIATVCAAADHEDCARGLHRYHRPESGLAFVADVAHSFSSLAKTQK